MFRTLFLIVLAFVSATLSYAQSPPIETMTIFYENPNPQYLDHVLTQRNVCLERFIQLNPDLNIHYIEYGEKIVIPKDEPCYNGRHQAAWDSIPRLKYYEHGQWLNTPYYSSDVTYRYEQGHTIENIAGLYDVCVDDLLAENILLQDFETYAEFTTMTSMDIFIPQGTPSCTPPAKPEPENLSKLIVLNTQYRYITPSYFSESINICVEEIAKSISPRNLNNGDEVSFRVSPDTPPCYNDEGHRLSYYDGDGEKRDTLVYSPLPVYMARPGESMRAIADRHHICIIDLLRHNGFLDMSINADVEVFLPPSRPCPPDIEAVQTFAATVKEVSHTLDICKDVLLRLNPQLRDYGRDYYYGSEPYNRLNASANSNSINRWVIVPTNPTPCYQIYDANEGESLYDLEQQFDVCYEEFTFNNAWRIIGNTIYHDDVVVYIPLNSQLCYNESGQRLYYPELPPSEPPDYADMHVYFAQRGDTAYSISQQFNVCVHDLIAVNRAWFVYEGHPVFIPDTRQCYDEATRLPLIYEDDDGNTLDQPVVGDQLIHYGNPPRGQLMTYYNVCQNRIVDANRAKLDKEAAYLGWIIPTDRPPCFDADWNPIHYVCYNQPIDMAADYRNLNEVLSFDVNGDHCYDLFKLETLVWYQNQPYKLIAYYDSLFESRAFTAWCYGVSLNEMNTINDEEAVLEILPFQTRLIPQPTRDCYLDNPDHSNGQTVHRIYPNETLSSIAAMYDVPYPLIALANGLDANNTIWVGQDLIIPTGFTWRGLIALMGTIASIGLSIILLYRRKRRGYQKKKNMPKNESLHS